MRLGEAVGHAGGLERDQKDLIDLEGMDADLAARLAASSVRTRDDLADLAVDELTEISGIDAEQAKSLIMKAREHWFTA